jgi:hypothetical protein
MFGGKEVGMFGGWDVLVMGLGTGRKGEAMVGWIKIIPKKSGT